MRQNVGFLECIVRKFFTENARIEIVDENDIQAKKLKPFAIKVAKTLAKVYPQLKILDVYKTIDPWNFAHPFLVGGYKGYVIVVPQESDFFSIKKTCMELEIDEEGKRIADIDVYLSTFQKISRRDMRLYESSSTYKTHSSP